MTKIFINTEMVKNNVRNHLSNAEGSLASIKYYFNNMVIPNDYINKDYLNWLKDDLSRVQDGIYDIKNNLYQAINTYQYRIENMTRDINFLGKVQINARKNVVK